MDLSAAYEKMKYLNIESYDEIDAILCTNIDRAVASFAMFYPGTPQSTSTF